MIEGSEPAIVAPPSDDDDTVEATPGDDDPVDGPVLDPQDRDQDGVADVNDCAPDDGRVWPGAPEWCDGVDNDCVNGPEDVAATWFPADSGPVDLGDALREGRRVPLDVSGVVRLCGGAWQGGFDITGPEVTIEGSAGAVVDAGGAGSVISAIGGGLLTVRGVSLRGGAAPSGGGLAAEDRSVHLVDVEVTGNRADLRGGGVFVLRGGLVAERVAFVANVSDRAGGALLVQDAREAVLRDVVVEDNRAGTVGGGLRLHGTPWRVDAGRVVGNTADVSGGAIASWAADGVIDAASEIADNDAGDHGGALYLDGGTHEVAAAVVGNVARNDGGAARVTGEAEVVFGGELRDNVAGRSGGALAVESASVTLRAPVSGNQATVDGGGLFVGAGAALSAVGVRVEDNTAGAGGGGISVDGGAATLSDVVIGNNRAVGFGGGARVLRAGSLTLDGGAVRGNAANDGGGVYAAQGTTVLRGTTVETNTALRNGGGLRVFEGAVELYGLSVRDNVAVDDGGGLAASSASVLVEQVEVSGNRVDALTGTGGAISLRSCNGTVADTRLFNNEARLGGGLFVRAGETVVVGGEAVGNTAWSQGGGVMIYEGRASLVGMTLASNAAEQGGGLFVVPGAVTELHEVQFDDNAPQDCRSGETYAWEQVFTGTCDGVRCS